MKPFTAMRCYLLTLLCLFFFGACKTPATITKKPDTENRKPTEPKKDKPVVTRPEVPEKDTPDKSDKHKESEKNAPNGVRIPPVKNTINIAVLLPMDGKYKYSRFAGFINGMMQSARNSTGSPTININVVNIAQETDANKIAGYQQVKNADMLVGGFITSQVRAIGEVALKKQVPFLSAWNSTDDIVANNPYFLQLKPSMQSYCSAIANYVSSNVQPDKTIILFKSRSSKDYTALPFYKSVFDRNRKAYSVFILDEGDDEEWKQLISNSNPVVIIPNWDDKDFIFQTLSKVRAARRNTSLITAGMPQWAEFEQVDFGLFESLNTIIPVANYVDPARIDVKLFKESYFDSYNEVPNEDAFYGADVMHIVSKLAKSLAAGQPFNAAELTGRYFSNYVISPHYPNYSSSESGSRTSYFANTTISLLKFEGGKFVPIY